MKKNGFSHIRRWLWTYTFIVILIVFTAFVFIYHEISNSIATYSLSAAKDTSGQHYHLTPPQLSGINIQILLILSLCLLAILFFTIAWLRFAYHRISVPLYTIRRAVYRLAQGKLNETVTINSNDEFGKIGVNINELAANLQELLLYVWKQTGQCVVILDEIKKSAHIENDCRDDSEVIKQLQELSSAIENLRAMAKSYVFYDVRLDGEQTLAINNPGRNKSSGSDDNVISNNIE